MTKEEHFENLKEDIKHIIESRTHSRAHRAFAQWLALAKDKQRIEGKPKRRQKSISNDMKECIVELRTAIKKDEFQVYFREIDRFEKKHTEDMLVIYSKARDGKNTSLWKLIKWDKSWLFIDWVKDRILQKENEDDGLFFSQLSDAIKKNTRFSLQSKGKDKTNKALLKLLQEMISGYPMKYTTEQKRWKEIYQILYNAGELENNKDILPVSNKDYFMKLAKRHGLKD